MTNRIVTIASTFLLLAFASPSIGWAQGKGKGKGKGRSTTELSEMPDKPSPSPTNVDPSAGFVTTITAIEGDHVTFVKPASGESTSKMGGGKGKGRFRSNSSGTSMTLPVSPTVLVTTATSARRTGDLLVGIELPGGLSNQQFDAIDRNGLRARIVIDGVDITEINVLVADDDAEAPIAVKPKRPTSKTQPSN